MLIGRTHTHTHSLSQKQASAFILIYSTLLHYFCAYLIKLTLILSALALDQESKACDDADCAAGVEYSDFTIILDVFQGDFSV